jgi:excisionase family DNA binding protein
MTRTREASSYQDILTGHKEDQDRTQERESLYVTIQEAARRCGVSNKTIQRAIQAGTLPAHYPKPNRCAIAVSDLERIRPGHVQTATKQKLAEQVSGHVQVEMEHRVATLEQRVQQLEHLVAGLLDRPAAPKRPSRAKAREHTTGPLPKQLISLLAFAKLHCVVESKVQTHVDMGLLPVKRGKWTDTDGTEVTLALDSSGRMAFYQLYRSLPHVMNCPQCPHGYRDSVSGQG